VTIARVVVGLPVPRVFSYTVPPALTGRLVPGQRVRVPFRSRSRVGVVVALDGSPMASPLDAPTEAGEPGRSLGRRAGALESLESLIDPVPALTPALLDLGRWVGEETASAWGEVIMRALPPGSRSVAPDGLVALAALAEDRGLGLVSGAGRGRLVEEAIEAAVGRGAGVLCLAPEIDVARTWAERLERGLGIQVGLATSAETPRRRWQVWWAARQGAVRVVVGTRAAAFMPLLDVGLTVVLDEEDPAHKAPDAPRWHTRTIAVARQAREGGACLLAAAAPSLESWVWGETGRASARSSARPDWPTVHRVDLRRPDPDHALSSGLRDAARGALAAGHSVLLLLNRLGYGRILACAECGAVRRCPTCRLPLTYHQAARSLACRLCGSRHPARSLCPRCRGRRLQPVGAGTERVEAEARVTFPGIAVARYDGTLEAATLAAVREAFARREVRVVVGTQMALRLADTAPVGVAALVHADTILDLPDFRAAERALQTAWRMADAVAPGGSLWLQSAHPDHPALEAVSSGQPDGFYRREWAERQELGYPPARRMARLVLEGVAASHRAQDFAAAATAAGLTVLGPADLPGHRAQVVLLGDGTLPRAVAELLAPLRGRRVVGGVRVFADIDPVELP
jgi:primosomal protein N' (replication factor Y)